MKNVFLLPTDKPSRLHDTFNILRLEKGFEYSPCNKELYITSDKEIKIKDTIIFGNIELKEGWNWGIKKINTQDEADHYNFVAKTTLGTNKNLIFKTIILTTDQDLISDGVQGIDNEFLEWFFQNPSCESVEIEDSCLELTPCDICAIDNCLKPGYKIIIPQEQSKCVEDEFKMQSRIINKVWDEDEMDGKINLWVVPTDTPSFLYKRNDLNNFYLGHLNFCESNDKLRTNQHIYITNSEEIEDGEYGICLNLVRDGFKAYQAVFKMDSEQRAAMEDLGGQKEAKVLKVILTTDLELIGDGIQAIDSEFLGWFIDNPNCEFVNIKENILTYKCRGCGGFYDIASFDHIGCNNCYRSNGYKREGLGGIPNKREFKIIPYAGKVLELNQETPEEAARRYVYKHYKGYAFQDELELIFIDGTKYQAEKMYSKEEVLEHLNHLIMMPSSTLDTFTDDKGKVTSKWFEQFKKK